MVAWLAGMLMLPAGYLLPAHHAAATPSGSGLVAVAAIALTVMLVAFLACGARVAAAQMARPLISLAVALREKSWSAAFQRQLNPDAPGRARPRAPSVIPAAV
jgi:hypothetical protein